jgi:hypothetical protein
LKNPSACTIHELQSSLRATTRGSAPVTPPLTDFANKACAKACANSNEEGSIPTTVKSCCCAEPLPPLLEALTTAAVVGVGKAAAALLGGVLLVQMSGDAEWQFSGRRLTVDCSCGRGVDCFVDPLWAKEDDDDDDSCGDHKNEAVS